MTSQPDILAVAAEVLRRWEIFKSVPIDCDDAARRAYRLFADSAVTHAPTLALEVQRCHERERALVEALRERAIVSPFVHIPLQLALSEQDVQPEDSQYYRLYAATHAIVTAATTRKDTPDAS